LKIRSGILLFVSVALVLGLWFILTTIVGVRSIFLPSIGDTFSKLFSLSQTSEFWLDVKSSFVRVFLGFLLSILVAYPLVIASLINKNVKEIVFYIVEFFRYLPIPVFIPLTILWFGVDDAGKVMIVFLGTFAQMIPMFYDSALLLENKYDAFSFGLKWSRWKYVKNIIVKGSAPYILDNSRLCFGWAWTYLIIAELLGAENGLGYAIIRAQRYLATDKIFAYIITIGLIGVLIDRSMILLKKYLFRWHT
jgi:NitT/TauT family transport system permease protein